MSDTAVSAGPIERLFRKENVVLLLALIVLLMSYISSRVDYSHHGPLGASCCGVAFLWSPLGCSLMLVAASLLLRFQKLLVYLVVVLLSVFALVFSSYVAFQRWLDYSVLDKKYALQQALLPLYRPLSIIISVVILVSVASWIVRSLRSEVSTSDG